MNYKQQRKEQISFLMSMVDCTLLDYEWLYNEEKVSYKCNKCSHEYKYSFAFMYSKIKHKQVCSCHSSKEIDMLPAFTLEEFEKTRKEMQEEKIAKTTKKQEFLNQESKQVMYVIAKNRGAKQHRFVEKHINITCENNHNFNLKYEDIIKGKWCDLCADGEDYYFDKKTE